MLQAVASAVTAVLTARYITRIVEKAAGYEIATKLILPEYEELNLAVIMSKLIKNPDELQKMLNFLGGTEEGQRLQRFIDFLREFNLKIAKTALKMSIVSDAWGNMTSRLLNAISWSFGFGWLSWMALSPLLNVTISAPARKTLTETFMPEELTAKERDLTKSDILRAYRKGIIKETDAIMYLKRLGYSDDEIHILLQLNKPLREIEKRQKERDLSTTQIIKAYKLNLIDLEEAKRLLRRLGYDEDEVNLLIKIYTSEKKIEKHERSKDLSKSEILKAFALGLLSFEDAKQRLIQLGYDEDEAELLLAIKYLEVVGRAGPSSST